MLKRFFSIFLIFVILSNPVTIFAQGLASLKDQSHLYPWLLSEEELEQKKEDYIKAHQQFLESAYFKNLTSDYKNNGSYRIAPRLLDAAQDLSFYENLWNFISLNWYKNTYDVVLADLLLDENVYNWQAGEMTKNLVSTSNSIYSQLIDILSVDWTNQYNLEIPKDEINTYLKTGSGLSEDTKDKLTGLYKNSALKEKYSNFFQKSSEVTGAISTVMSFINVAEGFKKLADYSATTAAYKKTSEEFKQSLRDIQKQAEKNNKNPIFGTDENRQLAAAIERYNQIDSDNEAFELGKQFVSNVGTPVLSIFKSVFSSKIKDFLIAAQKIAGVTPEVASKLSSVIGGLEVGYSVGMDINNILTPDEKVMANIDLMRSSATLEEAASEALNLNSDQFNKDPNLSNAQKIHYLKNIQIFANVYAMKRYRENLEETNEALITYITDKKDDNYETNLRTVDSLIRALNRINCDILEEEIDNENITKDITLILDVSGSMSGEPKERVMKSAKDFIDTAVDEKTNISVVAYDDQAELIAPFSNDATVLKQNIDSFPDLPGGSTNIGSALTFSEMNTVTSTANKKIFILMTDGLPTAGMGQEELIEFSQALKDRNITIYTFGFFNSIDSTGDKISAESLLTSMASPSSYFEATNTDNLYDIFDMIAHYVVGERYVYLEAACPVNVKVEYDGEVLDSSNTEDFAKTSFGILNLQEEQEPDKSNDKVKILRLKEGPDYNISISGTGEGSMDYQVGLMDENGEYEDYRYFNEIAITPQTQISTTANTSKATLLSIDNDGDGNFDRRLIAGANENGREYNSSWVSITIIGIVIITVLLEVYLTIRVHKKKKSI